MFINITIQLNKYTWMSNEALQFIARWRYVAGLEPTVSRIIQCTLIREAKISELIIMTNHREL